MRYLMILRERQRVKFQRYQIFQIVSVKHLYLQLRVNANSTINKLKEDLKNKEASINRDKRLLEEIDNLKIGLQYEFKVRVKK